MQIWVAAGQVREAGLKEDSEMAAAVARMVELGFSEAEARAAVSEELEHGSPSPAASPREERRDQSRRARASERWIHASSVKSHAQFLKSI